MKSVSCIRGLNNKNGRMKSKKKMVYINERWCISYINNNLLNS